MYLPKQRDSHHAPLGSMETLLTPWTPILHPAHPSYTLHTLFTPCSHSAHPAHPVHTLHTLFTPCSHLPHPVHTQHTLLTPCSHSAHPAHPVHTLHTPCSYPADPAHPVHTLLTLHTHIHSTWTTFLTVIQQLTTILRPNGFHVLRRVSIQSYFWTPDIMIGISDRLRAARHRNAPIQQA